MGKRVKKPTEFENLGSLITVKGTNQCLGYLMYFPNKGVYEPVYGQVAIPAEYVESHNKALSQAELEGLDRCAVGQCGLFYIRCDNRDKFLGISIGTFMGDVIAKGTEVQKTRNPRKSYLSLVFTSKGKKFKGNWHYEEQDSCTFTRIA